MPGENAAGEMSCQRPPQDNRWKRSRDKERQKMNQVERTTSSLDENRRENIQDANTARCFFSSSSDELVLRGSIM